MGDSLGTCPLCGGEKREGTTTFAVDLGTGVVVVRDVPAHVCAQCGESWIQHPVALKLEAIVAGAREKRTAVEVSQWADVAA